MPAAQRKHILLSDQETARILKVNIRKLYKTCDFFDNNVDDEWDLVEGEHFEWVRRDVKNDNFTKRVPWHLQDTFRKLKHKGFSLV